MWKKIIAKTFLHGVGQMGKGMLFFVTGGMMVGSGLWQVGIGAQNRYGFVSRAIARSIVNFLPNYIFDNAF